MANMNIGRYGLGYYGSGGTGQQNCEMDLYGSCTAPAGPHLPNLTYARCQQTMQPMSAASMQSWAVMRMPQLRAKMGNSGGNDRFNQTINYSPPEYAGI